MRNTRFRLLRPLFVVVVLVMGVLSPISLPGVVSANGTVSESVAAINDANDQTMRAALDVYSDYPTNSATPYASLVEGRKSAVATDMLASKPSNGGYTNETAGEMFNGLVAFRVEVARAVTAANETPGQLTVSMLRDLLATTAALPSGAQINGEPLVDQNLNTFSTILDLVGDQFVGVINASVARPFASATNMFGAASMTLLTGVLFVNSNPTVLPNAALGALGNPYPTIQAAVDAADNGTTILIGAGTYNEFVDVGKSLTLLGANAGVNPNTGTRGPESIIEYSGNYVVEIFANDVLFDGFSVNNSVGNAVRIAVGRQNLNSTAVVNNVTVSNTIATGGAILSCPECPGLYMGVLSFDNFEKAQYRSENIAFLDNRVTVPANNGRGITMAAYNGSQLTGGVTISGNHILTSGSPTDVAGIELRSSSGFSSMQNVMISGNNIQGFDIAGGWLRGDPTINISGNTFIGNVHDLRLDHKPANNNNVIGPNSFSGSSSAIRNNTTVSIDISTTAVGSTFGNIELTGDTSLAELFAIEDQIIHKVDIGTLGFVRVKTGEVFVTPNSLFDPKTTPSIQRGVDAATAGDTVHVAPGTYTGNVDVGKSLTILGANAGVNPNTGTRGPESIIEYSGDYAVEIFASDVLFDGLSVSNSVGNAVRIAVGRDFPTTSAVNNVTVSNTIATGGSILSCPSCTGLWMGVLSFDNFEKVQYRSENIAFLDNRVTVSANNGRGITVAAWNGAQLTGDLLISGNHILTSGSPTSVAGIELRSTSVVSSTQNVTISDNIIQGSVVSNTDRGIHLNGWTGSALIANNTITRFRTGVFTEGTLASGTSAVMRNNKVRDLHVGDGEIATGFANDQTGGTILFTGNIITGPHIVDGISSSVSAGPITIRGNGITGMIGAAVNIRSASVTVIDNTLSGNKRGVAFFNNVTPSAVTTATIRNNDLSSNTSGGIFLNTVSATVPVGVLRAAENFWGVGITPTVSAGVVGPTVTDLRSTAIDQVIISPRLDGPGGQPVLDPGAVLVVVTDVAGTPLGGITVTVTTESAATLTTDADGRALFGLPPGQVTVQVSPGGRLVVGSATRLVSVTADSAALVEFTLAALGSISGRVTNTSGDGVSGVTVAITGEQVVVVTGVDGSYVFSGRNPGTAVVSMTPPAGYLAVGRTVALVNLIAGSSAVADFQVIQTGRIAGRVVDSTGVGVAGVPVSLNGAAPVATSFDGGYAFTGQTPGGYTVTLGALPNGFVAARTQALVNLSAGSSAVADFQLTQTGRIAGRVVDSSGVGVAGIPVSLDGATPVETGLDGSYAFTGQNPGTYTVTLGALPTGFAAGSATQRGVVVAPGGSAIAEFLLVRTGVITGHITDLSGVGISGISVAIGSSSTTTGLDGRYEFAGQNPGIYSVALGALPGNFLAERGITTRTVNLAAGQGARADFRLVELGVVTGRVVDETGAGISGVTVTVGGTPLVSSIDGSYRLGGLAAGSNPAFSVDVPSGFALPTGRGLPTVTVGQIVPDVVLLQIGVVAGYAFLDLNGNDQRDPGEPPLAGVIATLTATLSAGVFSATATTSADGFYRFDGVPLRAAVTFSAPTGFVQADPPISQTGLRLSSRGIMLMNAGNSTFVQDVGLLPAGTVLGYVSLDVDPLAGVPITVGGSEQLTSQDGVALFRGVTGSPTMTVSVPDGFELAEGQSSRSVTPGTAPLQEFKLQLASVGQNPVQTPPPSTVIPGVRQVVPVVSGPVTSVAVTTAAGRVDLVFTGVASTTGTSPEVVVRPLGYRTLDRGILAAGQRFSITAERFTFAEVEVCLPVAGTAVAATQAAPDRVRLLHTRSDGSEHDVTTTYVPTGSNPRICGMANGFSTFQAVVVASERIAGADRYATAAQVAAETHPNGASLVYIASGNSSADALAAGAAAAVANAPLLLVSHGLVPVVTVQALEALAPTRVVVVGGTTAISSAVQTRIRSISGATVVRIGGADRYETAALLATDRFSTGVNTVYVVTGQNFPDALAAGAVAGQRNAAVVLVPESGVPESVATALQGLNPDRIIVVGGTSAVSAATFVTLQGYADQVQRIGGVDRYDTAARLTLDASPGQPLILVTGQNFPDALVAATLARRRGGAVLMVATESIPGATRTRTAALAPSGLVFVGGPQAMTPTVELRMVRLLNASAPGQW